MLGLAKGLGKHTPTVTSTPPPMTSRCGVPLKLEEPPRLRGLLAQKIVRLFFYNCPSVLLELRPLGKATILEFKELGQSGVMAPEIGLCTHRYIGGVDPLRQMIEEGATLIDTAESYGTENVVGQAVKGVRQCVIIATKISTAHLNTANVTASVDQSLRMLQTDYIDVYQLHGLNPTIPLAETMGALEEPVDAGKVRFIGVCNFTVAQLKRAQSALTKHQITTNQVDFSLITRNVDPGLLEYCLENRITIIAHSPLGRGLLNIRVKDRNKVLEKLARPTGRSEAQLALNWCISHQGIIAVPKSNSLERMIENCNSSGWGLSDEQKAMLENSVSAFRRRGPTELALRRLARRALQKRP